MSQENVELVRGHLLPVGEGRSGRRSCAPDVEWHWSSAAKAVRGGSASYRGLEGSARDAGVGQGLGLVVHQRRGFIDAGDRVVVFTTLHARLRTGRGDGP